MRPRSSRTRLPLFAGVALFATVMGWPSSAQAGPSPSGNQIAGWILLAVFPHDVGIIFPRVALDEPTLNLGYTLQFPVTENRRHRVVAGLDLNPMWDGHRARGRLGYRFGWRYPFFGFGMVADKTGFAFAPEVGVRLTSSEAPLDRPDFAAHVIVRADVPVAVDELRAVSVLLGWSLF